HLGSLPTHDQKSRVIVEQMKQDEIDHGNKARDAGGVDLPTPIKALMGLTSKILTKTAYRI
ncbi:MAG: demethoxyubiquinone hydroxylase family protein, partial [Gammaproteobacteria bacterium]|nr:demethoxyubiquinone hydroxylase family protein [Gammaproteobacteria bacterium]